MAEKSWSRPQKRALVEATAPVSRAEFEQLRQMVVNLQGRLDMLNYHAHYTSHGYTGGPEDRR